MTFKRPGSYWFCLASITARALCAVWVLLFLVSHSRVFLTLKPCRPVCHESVNSRWRMHQCKDKDNSWRGGEMAHWKLFDVWLVVILYKLISDYFLEKITSFVFSLDNWFVNSYFLHYTGRAVELQGDWTHFWWQRQARVALLCRGPLFFRP